jgi:xylulokinase
VSYLLGIDIGTSGTKTILINREGAVLASALAEYPLYSPRPLWSEQDPEDWWDAVVSTVRQVLQKSGIQPSQVAGVGLSGQMHGAVFLDENGQVLRRAILWNDQRTQTECDWITDAVGRERLVQSTCNPVLTGFQAPKIVWLRSHEPDIYAKVRRVLLPKDFIRYRLTGEFATEVSDASGTSLFDVKRRCWSAEVLAACGIPPEWLPKSYESPEISARVSASGGSATGLAEGTPVAGGAGDQAAGAVGAGIVEAGIVSSTVGTSGVVFAHSDTPAVDPGLRLHTFCHAVPGAWHVMGVVLSAGGSLQWYRDTFCGAEKQVAAALGCDPYELITQEAACVPAGCEGLVFLPYLTGERTPYPDPLARGAFVGATRRTGRPHFARAVLEGVAYALRDSFEMMTEMGVPIEQVRAGGGGARSTLWRQIQADVTGRPHVTINIDEGPALGVALLAGVGVGLYPSVAEACRHVIRVSSSTQPNTSNAEIYNRGYALYRGLYPALKETFASAAGMT